jgi:hypothetical protein
MSRTRRISEESGRNCRRWSEEENARLLRQVRAFPQNLSKCFFIVGQEIGRTDKAVAAHWYQHLSKREDALCFFTASSKHVSKNRKNSMGIETNASIWRRLVAIIRNIM